MAKSVNINMGQTIAINSQNQSLSRVMVGLGWDPVKKIEEKVEHSGFLGLKKTRMVRYNQDVDCDSFAILLNQGKVVDANSLIYFGHLKHPSGTIYHSGDNTSGIGAGDDERIHIDLSRINCESIIIGVNIYDAALKNQHFGLIENAFIRLVDEKFNREICRYSLNTQYSGFTTVIMGELMNYNGQWGFTAIGQPIVADSISEIGRMYGMPSQYRSFE